MSCARANSNEVDLICPVAGSTLKDETTTPARYCINMYGVSAFMWPAAPLHVRTYRSLPEPMPRKLLFFSGGRGGQIGGRVSCSMSTADPSLRRGWLDCVTVGIQLQSYSR